MIIIQQKGRLPIMKKDKKTPAGTLNVSPQVLARIRIYVRAKGMKIYAWVERSLEATMNRGE